MDYNQKLTRPVDLVFGEAQSGNLNNKDVPTRDCNIQICRQNIMHNKERQMEL